MAKLNYFKTIKFANKKKDRGRVNPNVNQEERVRKLKKEIKRKNINVDEAVDSIIELIS